jgi:hypothetical protein
MSASPASAAASWGTSATRYWHCHAAVVVVAAAAAAVKIV